MNYECQIFVTLQPSPCAILFPYSDLYGRPCMSNFGRNLPESRFESKAPWAQKLKTYLTLTHFLNKQTIPRVLRMRSLYPELAVLQTKPTVTGGKWYWEFGTWRRLWSSGVSFAQNGGPCWSITYLSKCYTILQHRLHDSNVFCEGFYHRYKKKGWGY